MVVFNFIIAPGRSVESVSEKDPSFQRGHILDRAKAELQKLLSVNLGLENSKYCTTLYQKCVANRIFELTQITKTI